MTAPTGSRIATFSAEEQVYFTSRRFRGYPWRRYFTMPSTISKKTTKSTSAFSRRTKSAARRHAKAVIVRASKGTLAAARFDAIAKAEGARALTAGEREHFRRFAKDPYP
jgi:hypothetical protein